MKFTNQYMLYDQNTFDFERIYPACYLKGISHVKNGVQYFASSKPDTDNVEYDTVVRFDEKGDHTILYDNIMSRVENIKRLYFKGKPIEFDTKKWSL